MTYNKGNSQEDIDYAWLNLGDVSKIHTDDILHACSVKDEEEVAYHLIKTMSDPAYFYILCRELINIQPAPFQCVIQQELWKHKFPMFIGCRGLSKLGLWLFIVY